MKRFKIYDLRLMIFLLLSVLFINHKSLFINQVLAADSTPSGLQEFKKELDIKAASISARLKETISKKLQNKAYTGKIKSKSDTSITLATQSNPKMVGINQDTVFASKVKGKTKYSQKNLAEEDYIVALGDADEIGVLTAKKIILLPQPPEKQKTFLWGQVISISDQLMTLKNSDSKNVAVSIASASGIKLNAFVILTGNQSKNDIFKAGFVYVIPQGGVIKPKKTRLPDGQVATPSAKVATSSAKPKPTSR